MNAIESHVLPLHRLLERRDVTSLLQTFAALVPGVDLALIGVDGKVFAGVGEWPSVLNGDGTAGVSKALEINGVEYATLSARGPISQQLLDALHHSLSLLLRQALEKRDLARETLERYREVNLMYQVGETIGASLNAVEIPTLVLQTASKVVHSDVSAVLLSSGGDRECELEIRAVAGAGEYAHALHNAASPFIAQAYETGRPDIITCLTEESVPLAALLVAPLKTERQMYGVVLFGRLSEDSVFTASDEKLVMALVSQAAIALERTWLYEQEISRQRMEEELAIGRQIQLSLLPDACPKIPGWDFATIYEAARQVGGDLYDFFDLPGDNRRLGLVIADATDKGVPAALFMAFSRAIIRSEALTGCGAASVLKRANEVIVHDNRTRMFLSAFYGQLDLETGELDYANGGHEWPLWSHAATKRDDTLNAKGVILGMFERAEFEGRKIQIEPSDVLVFYTDGVTEARSVSGELFGEERLQATLDAHRDESARDISQAIAHAVKAFSDGRAQSDDFTFFVIKRLG